MLKKLLNLIKEVIAIRKHLDYQWHFWIDSECLFCLQTKVQVENSRLDEKWRCYAIKSVKSLVQDRILIHIKSRIIDILGGYSKYFVPVKEWMKLPIYERVKRICKRKLR